MKTPIKQICDKALGGALLSANEIRGLFAIPPLSEESCHIQWASRSISEKAGLAEIHGQVGVNTAACPCNCRFCSFAAANLIFKENQVSDLEYIIEQCLHLQEQGANAIYLMATANMNFADFLNIAGEVRLKLQPESIMIANVRDIDYYEGLALKEAGFAGIYHAIRLGEGEVTRISPRKRLETVQAAKKAGLKVGTCVEPVGPEHSLNELVEKTIIAREIEPVFSGSARRISIPGSSLEQYGMVSEASMAHILAVVHLAMGPGISGNCTHEPNTPGAIAGANLFWAEAGFNPRDTFEKTEASRGFDIKKCQDIFKEAEFPVLQGSSVFFARD
ncbi:radical SAM protein [Syntrophomonas wolfei]|jgi:biotin synthase|uniref:radical SAM protein n=1 Tax=Syntrophomonas wolfei TaxID=863 RepID=UPI0007745032|nr:radical SAM protein [Syntrophomonas wolfei]